MRLWLCSSRCRGLHALVRSVCSVQSQHLELAAWMASVCGFTCLNKQTICLLPLHPLFLCSSTGQCFDEGSGSCFLRGLYLPQVAPSPPGVAPSSPVQCSLQFQTKYLLQVLKLILVLFKPLPNLMSKESLLCLSNLAEFWDVTDGSGGAGRGCTGHWQRGGWPGTRCALPWCRLCWVWLCSWVSAVYV